jgi:hypothetical protein
MWLGRSAFATAGLMHRAGKLYRQIPRQIAKMAQAANVQASDETYDLLHSLFVAQHRRDGVIENLDALDERWRDLVGAVHHEARGSNRQMPRELSDLPHELVSLAAHAAVVRQRRRAFLLYGAN